MSIESLSKRIDRLLELVDARRVPRTWTLVLEEGEDIPLDILAQMGPRDTVLIHEIPRGYLGDLSGAA